MEKYDGVGQPDLPAEDDVGREEDVAVPGAALRELAALLGGPYLYDVLSEWEEGSPQNANKEREVA